MVPAKPAPAVFDVDSTRGAAAWSGEKPKPERPRDRIDAFDLAARLGMKG